MMRQKMKMFWTLILAIALSACGGLKGDTETFGQAASSAKTLYIMVTVDWEGAYLEDTELDAMRQLRQDFPEVPFIQYLNAAYFTKPDANAYQVKQKIDSVLLPQDEHGLHIHGWKSLFEAAGVTHRRSPNWSPGGMPLTDADCVEDCGHSIPITAYTYDELRQVIATSIDILTSHGYDHPVSFRAGGWMSSDALSEALVAEGFTTDSSAVPTVFLKAKLGHYELYDMLVPKWASINSTSQPYKISTPQGYLWEVPDNGALADYADANTMFDVINKNLAALRNSASALARYVVIGFHQETAVKYGNNIRRVLSAVRSYNQRDNITIPIVYRTLNVQRN